MKRTKKLESLIDATIGHWMENEHKCEGATGIEKAGWHKVTLNNGKIVEWGAKCCPLCAAFAVPVSLFKTECPKCPISLYTDTPVCGKTPWKAVNDAANARDFPAFRKEVTEELDWLIETLI